MKDLIEALTIFLKYKNSKWPTVCDHDVLYIMDITKNEVSLEDQAKLEQLDFIYVNDGDVAGWRSYRFGSA